MVIIPVEGVQAVAEGGGGGNESVPRDKDVRSVKYLQHIIRVIKKQFAFRTYVHV